MQITPDNAFLKRCLEVKQNKNKCPKLLAGVFYARSIFFSELADVFLCHYLSQPFPILIMMEESVTLGTLYPTEIQIL